MIFNVDPEKNRRFMQKEDIVNERKGTKEQHEMYRSRLEKISHREKSLRLRIIQERGVED